MHECISKIKWGKVILVSFIYLGVSAALQYICQLLTSNYYQMPEYFGLWNKLMMPYLGTVPPFYFTLISLGYSLLSGFVLAILFSLIKDVWEKCFCKQISGFTLLVSSLRLVFTYIPMVMLFNVPILLVAAWFITSIIIVFLSSIAFVKILK